MFACVKVGLLHGKQDQTNSKTVIEVHKLLFPLENLIAAMLHVLAEVLILSKNHPFWN